MLQGGNEIWFEIGNTLGRNQLSFGKKIQANSFKYKNTLWKYEVINRQSDEKTKTDSNFNLKRYCKFGYFHRVLENVVSTKEGRQCQINVIDSIKSVINEQRRQSIIYK